MSTTSRDPRTLLPRAMAEFDARVRGVPADAWQRPTPCAAWSVGDVVNHMVYECRWTPHLLRGDAMSDVGDRYDGDLLGDDPLSAWAEAAHAAREAATAATLDETIHASFGDISGGFYLWQLSAEYLVHGWDVARGAGGDERFDPELVSELAEWFADYEQFYRDIGVTGEPAPVPDGADTQTRLLAAFGRRV